MAKDQFLDAQKIEDHVTPDVTLKSLVTTDKSTSYNDFQNSHVTHDVTQPETLLINMGRREEEVIGKKHFLFSRTSFLT